MDDMGGTRRCPCCGGGKAKVYDSRVRDSMGTIWRRRKCPACSHTWSTYEIGAAEYERIEAMSAAIERLRLALDTTSPVSP